MRLRSLALCAALLIVAAPTACTPTVALADAGTSVDLAPLAGTLTEIVIALVGGALLWLGKRALDWLNVDRDSKIRGALLEGAEAALDLAASDVRRRTQGAASRVDVRSEVLAIGSRYLMERYPDSLKHFQMKPVDVGNLLSRMLDGPDARQELREPLRALYVGKQ